MARKLDESWMIMLAAMCVAFGVACAAGSWFVAGQVYERIDPGQCGADNPGILSPHMNVTSEVGPLCVPASLSWLSTMILLTGSGATIAVRAFNAGASRWFPDLTMKEDP